MGFLKAARREGLRSRDVKPAIRARGNSMPRAKGCHARKVAVQEQLQDREAWSRRHRYGCRWRA
ncbi:MAG: hypothetical protein QW057_06655 [Candidatus Bathyarchaeia archaeon]